MAQVLSQIEALNRDFAHQVLDDHPALEREGFLARRPDSTGIHFCLAQAQVNGQTIPAIQYVPTTATAWSSDHAIHFDSLGGADAFRPDQFLNVWVGNFGDLAGYAQMPALNPATDGIVIDYRYFGSGGTAIAPYNDGKTLTHLVGNYLGLYDLWSDVSCQDDYVSDTPVHNAANYGCPIYRHYSLCHGGSQIEMTINFMDNTDDACMYMFTYGQLLRMHAVLSERGPRGGLRQGTVVCSDEDLPIVETTIEQRSNTIAQVPLDVVLYPNPAKGEVQITLQGASPQMPYRINIFNALGQLLATYQHEGTNPITLSCDTWGEGIRLVAITTPNQIITKTLIINE
ncbi:MAG: T9SS type A sorting domain-containing protein [Saprospiraceae bacterium]|nr:T9SS type A sorting domain-containing protein [Saprospiraceae bacterium]